MDQWLAAGQRVRCAKQRSSSPPVALRRRRASGSRWDPLLKYAPYPKDLNCLTRPADYGAAYAVGAASVSSSTPTTRPHGRGCSTRRSGIAVWDVASRREPRWRRTYLSASDPRATLASCGRRRGERDRAIQESCSWAVGLRSR